MRAYESNNGYCFVHWYEFRTPPSVFLGCEDYIEPDILGSEDYIKPDNLGYEYYIEVEPNIFRTWRLNRTWYLLGYGDYIEPDIC